MIADPCVAGGDQMTFTFPPAIDAWMFDGASGAEPGTTGAELADDGPAAMALLAATLKV